MPKPTRRDGPPGRDDAPRRRDGALREEWPALFPFGAGPILYLDNDAAARATPQERARSVWPFLVRSARRFCRSLRPRERCNFDPEDVAYDLYATLLSKDDRWIPDRGRYINFAGRIVANALHQLRDRAGTVHAPRNSACRLKLYRAEDEAGTLGPQKAGTLADIHRTAGDHAAVDDDALLDAAPPAPPSPVILRLRAALNDPALSFIESRVLTYTFGLDGHLPRDVPSIASTLRLSPAEVRRARARATARLRDLIDPPPEEDDDPRPAGAA